MVGPPKLQINMFMSHSMQIDVLFVPVYGIYAQISDEFLKT